MFGDGIKYICRLYWWFIIDVDNRQRRHHVYAIRYYSSGGQELLSLSGVLVLEHLPWGQMMNPQEYDDQN
jgi:hypothetical protein